MYAAAKPSVISAIHASDIIIRYLRLCLSAHTPANGEINVIGNRAAQVNSVIITPDLVSSVIFQVMACCTSIEPNIDTNCPMIYNVALRFQLVISTPLSIDSQVIRSRVPNFSTAC